MPYEFNYSDLQASLQFVEDYLNKVLDTSSGVVANPQITQGFGVIRYMVSQIQYGGKIFDNLDRELFDAYANVFLADNLADMTNEYNLG